MEVKRSERFEQRQEMVAIKKRIITFKTERVSASIYEGSNSIEIVEDGISYHYNKGIISHLVAVLQAIEKELEDKKIRDYKGYATVDISEITFADAHIKGIWKEDKILPIIKDIWLLYFKTKNDMMEYNSQTAEAEYYKLIVEEGWGKARVAYHIAMKKQLATANGNTVYGRGGRCGYCFAWIDTQNDCPGCIYKEFYPRTKDNKCNVTNADDMIKRFQNPKLLQRIKEYDESHKRKEI